MGGGWGPEEAPWGTEAWVHLNLRLVICIWLPLPMQKFTLRGGGGRTRQEGAQRPKGKWEGRPLPTLLPLTPVSLVYHGKRTLFAPRRWYPPPSPAQWSGRRHPTPHTGSCPSEGWARPEREITTQDPFSTLYLGAVTGQSRGLRGTSCARTRSPAPWAWPGEGWAPSRGGHGRRLAAPGESLAHSLGAPPNTHPQACPSCHTACMLGLRFSMHSTKSGVWGIQNVQRITAAGTEACM